MRARLAQAASSCCSSSPVRRETFCGRVAGFAFGRGLHVRYALKPFEQVCPRSTRMHCLAWLSVTPISAWHSPVALSTRALLSASSIWPMSSCCATEVGWRNTALTVRDPRVVFSRVSAGAYLAAFAVHLEQRDGRMRSSCHGATRRLRCEATACCHAERGLDAY